MFTALLPLSARCRSSKQARSTSSAIARLFCILYLVLQLQAQLFKEVSDDYVALASSASHGALLLVCRHQSGRALSKRKRSKTSCRLGLKISLTFNCAVSIVTFSCVVLTSPSRA